MRPNEAKILKKDNEGNEDSDLAIFGNLRCHAVASCLSASFSPVRFALHRRWTSRQRALEVLREDEVLRVQTPARVEQSGVCKLLPS